VKREIEQSEKKMQESSVQMMDMLLSAWLSAET